MAKLCHFLIAAVWSCGSSRRRTVAVPRRRLFLNPPPLAGEVARSCAPEGATETLIHRENTI